MLAKKHFEPLTQKIDMIERLSERLPPEGIPDKPSATEIKLYKTVMCPLNNRRKHRSVN